MRDESFGDLREPRGARPRSAALALRDVRASPATRLDDAVAFQLGVGAVNGVGIDPKRGRNVAYAGQAFAASHVPASQRG